MNTIKLVNLGLALCMWFLTYGCKEKSHPESSISIHTDHSLQDITFKSQIFVNITNPKSSRALELRNTMFEYVWIRNLQVGNRSVGGIPYCWNGAFSDNSWEHPLKISQSADEILTSIGATKLKLKSRQNSSQIQDIWYYTLIASEFLNDESLCVDGKEGMYWRRVLEANVASVLLLLYESELGGDELLTLVQESFSKPAWTSITELAAEVSKGTETDLFKQLYNDVETFTKYGKPLESPDIGQVELTKAYAKLASRMATQ